MDKNQSLPAVGVCHQPVFDQGLAITAGNLLVVCQNQAKATT